MKSKMDKVFGRICLLVCALGPGASFGEEPDMEGHVDVVVSQIKENVRKIRAADANAVPMAFWDFDGTIICGDFGIGLVEDGVVRYHGVIERVIEAGLLPRYRCEDGYRKWRRDYDYMSEIGPWLAQGYDAQMLAGVSAEELDRVCTDAIHKDRISNWYFASSLSIWKALEKAGVENYVVSASIEGIMRNAAFTLGIPPSRIHAARTELVGGRWSTRLLLPIPHGEGKAEVVRNIVRNRPHGVAVAAFGNCYATDGAFLRYVATQPSLPGGAKGTATMINGGERQIGFSEHFICVVQRRLCGGESR